MDLLPDREMKTLANWLRAHNGIEIVSRDRASAYSEAIKNAAPQAIQVADGVHLAQNLKSTVERFIRRNYPKITALLKPVSPPAPLSVPAPPTPSQIRQARLLGSASSELATAPILKRRDREKATTQAKRLALYQQVQELVQQGLARPQIAQQLGISTALVRHYLKQPPEPVLYPAQPSKLDPYKAYIKQRFFVEGCHNSLQLMREIKAQGYSGGSSIVTNYVTTLRAELSVTQPQVGESNDQATVVKLSASSAKAKLPSPRQLSWWFCLPSHRLNSAQLSQLEKICQSEAEFGRAYALAQQFSQLLNSGEASGLYDWLLAIEEKPISEFESLGWGIGRDRSAVEAGVSLPWNQGQTEGQVNRLKTIKRMMYNRSKFDLLRARVLYAA